MTDGVAEGVERVDGFEVVVVVLVVVVVVVVGFFIILLILSVGGEGVGLEVGVWVGWKQGSVEHACNRGWGWSMILPTTFSSMTHNTQ